MPKKYECNLSSFITISLLYVFVKDKANHQKIKYKRRKWEKFPLNSFKDCIIKHSDQEKFRSGSAYFQPQLF